METIHLELTTEEAGILIYALGACYKVPDTLALAQRVMKLVSHPALPTGAASPPPPPAESRLPAAAAAPKRPIPGEYDVVQVQTARSGQISTKEIETALHTPNGELTITPVEVEQSADGKAMLVTYRIRTGTTTKSKTIRTWDPKLFSDLVTTKGVPTTFLVKESKGFLNIVGVKR